MQIYSVLLSIQILFTIFVPLLNIKMAKQVKIKDIARMAGVSAGTVDRILHNRGNVSAKSREAVEKVLAEVGYRYNIHTSAISVTKNFKIVITTPNASIGEYWGDMQSGFEMAFQEFNDLDINCTYIFYNQFDVYSCRTAFAKVPDEKPDAVIIGPTFSDESRELCRKLDADGVPYVFVDSKTDGTNPIETFTTDQYACGYLTARILDMISVDGCSLAIFKAERIGDQHSSNSLEREAGFEEYMKDNDKTGRLKRAYYSVSDIEQTEKVLMNFIKENPDVKGMAVLNSRGYILADILHANNIHDIKIVSFDLTYNNRRGLRNGSISALLCQKPQQQGFNAVKAIINKLLYNRPAEMVHHMMSINIILKENLPFYKEI